MVILNQGMQRVRTLLNADITHAQAGSGTTVPAATQTALVTAVADTLNTTTNTVSATPETINVEHIITMPEAIGENLTEWELRCNSNATSFNRTVTAALAKTSTQEVTRIATIEITQE